MQVGHSTLYSLSLSTKTRRGHILSSGRRSVKALTKLAISTIMLMPGCTPPFTHLFLPKPDPKIATPYEPPPVYAEWWAAAESCAHRHKDLHHWKWYAVKWPHLDGVGLDPGLSTERNEVYVRDNRTLDRTEVLSQMAWMLTPIMSWIGDPEIEFFQKTLTCVGISNANWRVPWRPNPS